MVQQVYSVRPWLSLSATSIALFVAAPTAAQSAAETQEPVDDATDGVIEESEAIVVTGSRIDRAGFDQPTPTTILSGEQLLQVSRPNLQQALNDLPQTRNSVSPTGTIGNTVSGVAPVDLRGLGVDRTLTLLNGRRFVSGNNLNFIPTNLVERVELVTGGASAAWGSDAVAGVVNIIINEDLEGLSLGAETGISSRGDGSRYRFDGSFGTSFANGRGHLIAGAEYVDDRGITPKGRVSRPFLGAGLVPIGNGQLELQSDVNGLSPITLQGTILSGSLAGQLFNSDGSLRQSGPSDYFGIYDLLYVASPLQRLSSYGRLSYEIVDNVTIWADAAYGRARTNQPFFPDISTPVFQVSATNPFLTPTVRQQLANAGETSLLIGRLLSDSAFLKFEATRETKEGAIGINGSFGKGWEFDAHFSHGEVDDTQRIYNSLITDNFLRAIDSVSANGQIVCRVNADANPNNDDAMCAPFNPFGIGSASPEAVDYVTGTQFTSGTTKLDATALRIQGDLFSLWAGPVTIAVGLEARWQERSEFNGALDRANVFGLPVFTVPLEGGFNVKEGFAEALVPLLDTSALKFDLNGAARYSDYSLSGGIWSWKIGGTARIFGDLLLRATRSRDIRAPNITDLFAVSSINIIPIVDLDTAGRNDPGYNSNPQATIFSGGNPDLVPEVSKTWTVGGSFAPSFLSGFNLSVDYYNIEIGNAIAVPNSSDVTAACAQGDAEACSRVVRDQTGTVTTVFAFSQNISRLQTSGIDFEASYALPLSGIGVGSGRLLFRALATYVDELVFETGFTSRNVVGNVGDTIQGGLPNWRGNFSADYNGEDFGLNARLRYVGGGDFNSNQNIVNGDVSARTYVDIGAQFQVADALTLYGNVSNLFNVEPPLIITTSNVNYDSIGRYFAVGARVKF